MYSVSKLTKATQILQSESTINQHMENCKDAVTICPWQGDRDRACSCWMWLERSAIACGMRAKRTTVTEAALVSSCASSGPLPSRVNNDSIVRLPTPARPVRTDTSHDYFTSESNCGLWAPWWIQSCAEAIRIVALNELDKKN